MDFNLSKKHLLAQSLYRSFTENEVKPLAIEVDETEDFGSEGGPASAGKRKTESRCSIWNSYYMKQKDR